MVEIVKAPGFCPVCQHQHTGLDGACVAPVETTPPSEETDVCPCETRLFDVLIKTVVNVKMHQVPARDVESALRGAEEVLDFNRIFHLYKQEWWRNRVFPKVAYVEWAEEHTDALVDVLDQVTGDVSEDVPDGHWFEMRTDGNGDNLDWRPSNYGGAREFAEKLAELRRRDKQDEDGEDSSWSGNDEEIDFLRELVELAANSVIR